MTENNFPDVMIEVFKHEGGYVNDPRDAGGETNLGISKRAHPNVDIRNLTKSTARTIYRRDYWDKVKAGQFPDGLDLVLMDASVNSGNSRGSKWMQKGLGFKGRDVDGVVGKQTIAAANDDLNGIGVIRRACAARMGFLKGLRVWSIYKGGWSRRVASVEAVGVRMWLDAHKAAPTRSTLVGLGQEAETTAKGQKKAAAATGASSGATGLGGESAVSSIDGLTIDPMFIVVAVVVLGLVALVVYGRSRNNKIRAEAYEAEAVNVGVE